MEQTVVLPMDRIKANPYQPRLEFNQDALMDLAQSIQENGLIQPISVREMGESYEIVAGERRFRAMKLLGKLEVPVVVLSADDLQMAELALIENIQRENLSAIEEAKAYLQIMKGSNLNQSQLALKMGKSQGAIANKIRLLQLCDEVQEAVSAKVISERHARAMLQVASDQQTQVLKKIKEKGLTVAQTEKLVAKEPQAKPKKSKTFGLTRDIKIAINTIVRAVDMVKRTGVAIEMKEDNTKEDYEIIIKIPR
ncbi:MAG: ParB/RepB/Spo0J family partition protein [Erysipelotrichaceae bacterium]